MYYSPEDKRQTVAEYNRRYRKMTMILVVTYVLFAVALVIFTRKFPWLMYTKSGNSYLYGAALLCGVPAGIYRMALMKCPLCGEKYGRFYRRKPDVCPHCGESLT